MELDCLTISVAKAAQLLGVSRAAAYRAAANGTLPAVFVGKRIVVPIDRFQRLMAGDDTRAHAYVDGPGYPIGAQ